MRVEEKVREAIKKVVSDLGFEIEYVEFVKEGSNNILRVAIDKESDISIDDCEIVSRKIEDDVESVMNDHSYVLEVCSAGLERHLKNIGLYNKYLGYDVHVKLFKKIDLGKEFDAKLVGVDNSLNEITFEKGEDKQVSLIKVNLKDIASAYTIYDFEKDFKSENRGNK